MEKSLKLYIRRNGVDEIPFPNEQEQASANSFTYNAARMGDAPSLSLTVMHTLCLDNEWTKDVYVKFNGERYYLRQTPTSSFDNKDSRYKHEVEMVSERVILNDVYFFDVVSNKYDSDKPISNSSNVVFFGDIHEFANRLRASLAYSNLDYEIVIDEGVSSEGKLMSFDNMFFSNVLQEIYNTYELPYYFVGKTIHIGEYENKVSNVFEYGSDKSLLSVTKSNANFKVVNRCTGVGSSNNIPYYYPNPTPYGELAYFYNGVKTDQLRVFDWGRFARCGVDGELEYTKTKNYGETVEYIYLDDLATYEVKRIMTIMDRKVYGWVGVYDIDVTIANGVLVGAIGNSHDDAYYKLEIHDEDDIFLWEGTMLPPQGLKLPSKKYKLYATFSVGSDDVNAESTARRYGYLSLSLKTEDYEVESWELNGVAVTLNSLGIQYTGGAFNVGDTISFAESKARVAPSANLMPWIYRRSDYVDRFYNAENHSDADNTNHQYDAYKDGQGGYYKFNNPYVAGWPKEHIVDFPDIKPTIEGVIVDGEHINTIVDFAYDLYDNDEIDENNNYKHPYFFAKLRRFDFNLFTHAIEGGAMTISMTSGPCGACKWTIGVDDSSKLNPVQVDDYGNLLRDDNGNVIVKGAPQDRQNDTERYSVWVALKKEESTFGVVMPNASNPYRPNPGDSFVILDISLPQSYITNAEQRLAEAIVKYMSENNDEKFNFAIKLSRIYLEENPDVLQSLNENSKVTVKYNNKEYDLHVSSYSYKKTANEALPEVSVELSDTLTVSRGVMQNTINAIKGDINTVRTQYKEEVVHAAEKKANKATTLAGYGITDAFTMSEARDEFMSTRSSEDITGVKNFADGLKIGGLHIRYDVPTDSFIFPANVLIEKGLASYSAIDNDKIMSIFDGLPIDNNTLQWQETEDGKILVAKGGGSGGGIDEDKLKDYLDAKKYVTESWIAGKSYYNSETLTKSVIKTKLGIADWALAASKPSYTFSEITGKPTTIAGYRISDAYTKTEVDENFLGIDDIAVGAVTLKQTATSTSYLVAAGNGFNVMNPYDSKAFWFGYGKPTGSAYATTNWRFGSSDGTGESSGNIHCGSVSIGGAKITYNSAKNALILPFNVIIEGGLATYTKLSGFTNLDVMGGVVVDNETIAIVDGALKYIGSTGGGGSVSITGAASTIVSSNLTASRALVSNSSGKVAVSSITSTKLGYLTDVTSNIQAQLNNKQATLVSGTNIKTINNQSILGSGNISISGGASGDYLPLDGGEISGTVVFSKSLTASFAGAQIQLGPSQKARLSANNDGSLWLFGSKISFYPNASASSANTNQMVLATSGTLTVSGAVTENSDRKLKNIEYEGDGLDLDALKKVKVAKWKWKDQHDKRLHIGGVADNLAEVMPEVVFESQEEDGTTTSSIAYGKAGFSIAASLIAPVARHEDRIKELEKNIEKMQKELNKLKKSA